MNREEGWEGGIHTFDSFGRALVAEAVRQANQQVAEGTVTGDSVEISFNATVKFEDTPTEAKSQVCCVCTDHGGFSLCKGYCCS